MSEGHWDRKCGTCKHYMETSGFGIGCGPCNNPASPSFKKTVAECDGCKEHES